VLAVPPSKRGTVSLPVFNFGQEQSHQEQRALLNALAEAAATRNVRPAGDLSRIKVLISRDYDRHVLAAAARLVGLWKVETARDKIIACFARPGEDDEIEVREPIDAESALIAALGELGPASKPTLLEFCKSSGPSYRQAAVVALISIDIEVAAKEAVGVLQRRDVNVASIIEAFASRPPAAAKLRESLDGGSIPTDVAKLAVRTALASAKPDEALVAALRKAGGITGTGLRLSADEVRTLVAEVQQRGNAARGEALYHRQDLSCTKCHAIGGAGGRVGPDLVSIGASAQPDYLVDSMLDPNKAVKEGYHSVVVSLDDGRTLSGVKVRETDKDLLLRDAEDREIAVPLASIEEQSPGKSLMPAGLVDSLTRDELIDLVRFLTELGKVGPYQLRPTSAGAGQPVRRWESFVTTPEGVELLRRNRVSIAASGDARLTWRPTFARFDGTLPLDALATLGSVRNKFMAVPPYSIARFQFDAAADGDVELRFNTVDATQIWLDGKPLDAAAPLTVFATKGRHTVTLAVDREKRTTPISCELVDVPNSPAKAMPVVQGTGSRE